MSTWRTEQQLVTVGLKDCWGNISILSLRLFTLTWPFLKPAEGSHLVSKKCFWADSTLQILKFSSSKKQLNFLFHFVCISQSSQVCFLILSFHPIRQQLHNTACLVEWMSDHILSCSREFVSYNEDNAWFLVVGRWHCRFDACVATTQFDLNFIPTELVWSNSRITIKLSLKNRFFINIFFQYLSIWKIITKMVFYTEQIIQKQNICISKSEMHKGEARPKTIWGSEGLIQNLYTSAIASSIYTLIREKATDSVKPYVSWPGFLIEDG